MFIIDSAFIYSKVQRLHWDIAEPQVSYNVSFNKVSVESDHFTGVVTRGICLGF